MLPYKDAGLGVRVKTKPMHAETFFKPLFAGPIETKVDGRWSGRTDIGSGLVTVTVSTPLVSATSMILTGLEIASGGIISSAGAIVVSSVVPGVSFALTRDSGVAAPWTTTVMWLLIGAAS